MRTVKRYANRKLYDLADRRYITLGGLAVLIQGGEDVEVVDNDTGQDISTQILAQVILEREKARLSDLPKALFLGLIRAAGDGRDILKRALLWHVPSQEELEGIRAQLDSLERKVDALLQNRANPDSPKSS